MRSLQDFLFKPSRNEWVKFEHTEIYLRTAQRVLRGDVVSKTLDIANILTPEVHQRKGTFKRALTLIAVMHPTDFVYIENVANEHLERYLRNHQWVEADDLGFGGVHSFYQTPRKILKID